MGALEELQRAAELATSEPAGDHCVKCFNHAETRPGCEPTALCDPCAQELAIDLGTGIAKLLTSLTERDAQIARLQTVLEKIGTMCLDAHTAAESALPTNQIAPEAPCHCPCHTNGFPEGMWGCMDCECALKNVK